MKTFPDDQAPVQGLRDARRSIRCIAQLAVADEKTLGDLIEPFLAVKEKRKRNMEAIRSRVHNLTRHVRATLLSWVDAEAIDGYVIARAAGARDDWTVRSSESGMVEAAGAAACLPPTSCKGGIARRDTIRIRPRVAHFLAYRCSVTFLGLHKTGGTPDGGCLPRPFRRRAERTLTCASGPLPGRSPSHDHGCRHVSVRTPTQLA